MIALLNFIFFIAQSLLSLLWWAIIIAAVISWLVAFDVINLRNHNAYMVANFFDRVTHPILRPFQRIVPSLGGVDISPIIVLLVISGIKSFLLPALHGALVNLVGGPLV